MRLKRLWIGLKKIFRSKKTSNKLKKPRKKVAIGPQNEALQIENLPEKLPPPKTLKSGISAIVEFSLVQLSPHTQRAYRKDLDDFLSYLKVQGLLEIWGALGAMEIAQYRDYLLKDRGLSKASITRKIAVVKSFFKWAKAQGWVNQNPAELIRSFPQTQDSKTGFLNEEEIYKMLGYYPDMSVLNLSKSLAKVALETLLMLGIRRSEATAIRIGDLEFSDGRWLLNAKGKAERLRRLPIPPRLLDTWSEWFRRINNEAPLQNMIDNPAVWLDWCRRDPDQPLLISTRATHFHKSLSTSELAMIIRKLGRKAGLNQKLSPHMLRSTAITYALDQGASHRGIQQMAGWTTPLMISRYDKRRNDPRFSAVHHLKYAQKIEEKTKVKEEKSQDLMSEKTQNI
ncbi:MAG: tyrosine-type recombinase/integrase [Proteobacteria bacterium]|nr:tyrosine-type recombinase/integrase [Pseudomonadota bacterium]